MTPEKQLTRSVPSTVQATAISTALLTVPTPGRDFVDLTSEAARFINEARARDGALTLRATMAVHKAARTGQIVRPDQEIEL